LPPAPEAGFMGKATSGISPAPIGMRGQTVFEILALSPLDAVLIAGADGTIRYLSPACEGLTGYGREELRGALNVELVHPDDREHLTALWRSLAQAKRCHATFRFLRKDGLYIRIESSVDLVSPPGESDEIVAIFRDVTALRKRHETDLFDLPLSAMLMTACDGTIVRVNVQTERIFGYARGELVGQSVGVLIPQRQRSDHGGHTRAFSANPSARVMGVGRRVSGQRKDGSEVPVEINLNPIETGAGHFVLASIVDVTERRAEEDRLELFAAIVEGARDYAIFMLDPGGRILTWNEGAHRLKGYTGDEIVGQHFSRFYTAGEIAENLPENELRIAADQGKFEGEGWRVKRDGSLFWASVLITAIWDKSGKLRGYSKLTRDNTERKQSHDRLRESESSLRLMANAMPQIVWTARSDGVVDYLNDRWYEITGCPAAPTGDPTWVPTLHPDDREPILQRWQTCVSSGDAYEMKARLRNPQGEGYRWFLVRGAPVRDDYGAILKWIGTATDINENENAALRLEQRVRERTSELDQMVTEKTLLLKEIHHRVKNNLQVICSLLSMQVDYAGNDALSRPLKDALSRVLAMSLIHEKMYRSETVADLDFGAYIELLAAQLLTAYCVDPTRVKLELNVEPLYFNLHEAIPCGLILNELVSNSLKHAFRDGRQGVIRISLSKADSGSVELTVADNGIGLPGDFRIDTGKSFGMQILDALRNQLRAECFWTGEGGTTFRLVWKSRSPGQQATVTPDEATPATAPAAISR